MPNKKSRLSLSQMILHQILFHCDLYQQWASPNARRRAHQEVRLTDEEWQKILADRERKRTIIRLRKKKWIQDRQQGAEVIIKITKDAVVQELKRRIRQTDKKMPEEKVCLILFDFPNSANAARRVWRKFLLSANFKREQLSAWATNRDVTELSHLLVQMLGLEKWVQIYQARRS